MRTPLVLAIAVITTFALPLAALAADSSPQSEHYRFDSLNFASNNVLTSSNDGVPPQISSKGPSVVALSATSATIVWDTDKNSSSQIAYGTTDAYGQLSGALDSTMRHSVTIANLNELTAYHYQVVSTDAYGQTARSIDYSLTTPAIVQFKDVSVSQVTYDTALVSVTAGGLWKLKLSYGESMALAQAKQLLSSDLVAETTFALTGLTTGTKYYISLEGTDNKSNKYMMTGLSFVTIAAPVIGEVTTSSITPNDISVSVTTNTPTSLILTYQSNLDPQPLTTADTALAETHLVKLSHLSGNTQYFVTMTAIDAAGRRATKNDIKVTTGQDTVPPVLTDPILTVTKVGNEISMTARWDSNKPAKSTVSIVSKVNPKDAQTMSASDTFTLNQSVTQTGLAPRTPYQLTVNSMDASGNKTSQEVTFYTPSINRSIFDMITTNLAKVIDPLSRLIHSL